MVTDMPFFLVGYPTGKLLSLTSENFFPDVWDDQRKNRRISFADTGKLERYLILL
jgi:hypothetical protein